MSTMEIVIRTILVMIVVFCGVIGLLLKIYGRPSKKYDGYLNISQQDSRMIHELELETEPEQLNKQNRMVLKIRHVPPS